MDKTEIAQRLDPILTVFSSRPRRFWQKSVYRYSSRRFFEGNPEIIEGFEIYDQWDFRVGNSKGLK
ncbi:hypothetical protein [Cylindrospermopsis raciborskii]|uniref:hypothetical protein n=1 Tax=Cylindrospermopsis raciborskii TaxID=77022 RepID=UPI0039BE68ED